MFGVFCSGGILRRDMGKGLRVYFPILHEITVPAVYGAFLTQ